MIKTLQNTTELASKPPSKTKMDLPQVHFGKVGKKPKSWRDEQIDNMDQDDDSELPQTPPDVLKMLGFDPREIKQIRTRLAKR